MYSLKLNLGLKLYLRILFYFNYFASCRWRLDSTEPVNDAAQQAKENSSK